MASMVVATGGRDNISRARRGSPARGDLPRPVLVDRPSGTPGPGTRDERHRAQVRAGVPAFGRDPTRCGTGLTPQPTDQVALVVEPGPNRRLRSGLAAEHQRPHRIAKANQAEVLARR